MFSGMVVLIIIVHPSLINYNFPVTCKFTKKEYAELLMFCKIWKMEEPHQLSFCMP